MKQNWFIAEPYIYGLQEYLMCRWDYPKCTSVL